MEKQKPKKISKILYNKRNKKISETLDENVIIKGIFNGEFLNKYSILRSSIKYAIPLIIITAIMYLVVNTLWGMSAFITSAVIIDTIYSILYFINFQRIFFYLNWVLVQRKKLKKNITKQSINIADGKISLSNESTLSKYFTFKLQTKFLLESNIYDTFIKINEILSQIKVEYKIIADKQGFYIQSKELDAIKKAFNDYPIFEAQEVLYSPEIDFNNTKHYDYEYRKFYTNNTWYKFAFVNINKLQHSVSLSDFLNNPSIKQVIVFSKPFNLDLKKKNNINENIKVLEQELSKNNAVNASSAYNDLQHTLSVLTNLADDKTSVSASTMMIIYEAKEKNLLKDLTLKYKLTIDKEYNQAYSIIQSIKDNTIYNYSSIFNEVSCFNLANLLLSTHQKFPNKKANDMILGWKDNKDFYFNNIDTTHINPNRNLIIIASSGGGKSYTMHRLVKYNNSHNVKCILIDPNNQIEKLANANDFDISKTKFNLFALNENESLEDKIEFLLTILNFIITIPNEVVKSAIKTTLKTFYQSNMLTPYNQNISAFTEYIKDNDVSNYFRDINTILNNNQKLANLFDKESTTIQFQGDNLLFPLQQYININNTAENKVVLLTMFYMIDNFIQEQFRNNQHTMIYIDEAHNFFKPEYLPYLLKLTKELRKYLSGIAFITQNFKDMFSNDVGDIPAKIFANCSHKMILKVEGSDLKTAIDNELFGSILTNENKTLKDVINNLETGQMIYFDNDIHFVDTVEDREKLMKNKQEQAEKELNN